MPSELEEAILALGAYEEACIFPVPDREIGNRICVVIADQLPKNANGKTQRSEVARLLQSRASA